MAVLCCLADVGGEVVSKDALLRIVWGDAIVTDDALTQCVVELRKALNDSARKPELIETIPRVGYRLIPKVLSASKRQTPPWPASRLVAVFAAALLIAAVLSVAYPFYASQRTCGVDSVAVLPFDNLSDDPSMSYFSDGLAEELRDALANGSDMRVPARTSSFAFRDAGLSVKDIAARLAVDTVVEGSVRRRGSRLRVTVQVIHAPSGRNCWSHEFEGDTSDLFALQKRISNEVASALGVSSPLRASTAATDIQAYDWYLLGRQQYREQDSRQRFGDWVERSRSCFVRAIDRDPDFAAAYPWLARTWLPLLHSTREDEYEVSMLEARRAVHQALALDPALADAYAVLAWIQTNDGDPVSAEASLRRTLELDAHHVDAALRLAQHRWRRGFPGEAAELFERTHSIDPYNREVELAYANYLAHTGRYPQAAEILEKLLPRSSHWLAGFACDYGQLVECVRIARQGVVDRPRDGFARTDLAAAYRALHFDDLAQRWLEDAMRTSGETDALEAFFAEGAILLQERGEFSRVLDELDRRIALLPIPRARKPSPELYAREVLYATALTFAGRNEPAAQAWDRVFEYPEMQTYSDMSSRLARKIQAAYVYRETGRTDAYDRMVDQALTFARRLEGQQVSQYPPLAVQLATLYALIGQNDLALTQLRHAVELGWRDTRPPNPVWSSLRDDPRYKEIMSAVTADLTAQREQILRLGWVETSQEMPAAVGASR